MTTLTASLQPPVSIQDVENPTVSKSKSKQKQKPKTVVAKTSNPSLGVSDSQTVDDIVQSFIENDLKALDSFGDIALPKSADLLTATSTATVSPQTTRETLNDPLKSTPKSHVSSKSSIDSIESKYAATAGNLVGKFRTFGRRIVSSSAAQPSSHSSGAPTSIALHPSRSRIFRSTSASANPTSGRTP